MICLALKFLPGWLFGISTNRIKEELREKIIQYQRESYDVLWEAFQEGRLTSGMAFEDLLSGNTPAAQAYKIASAIMKIAQQQLLLETELETHATYLHAHEQRIEAIEATLGDPRRFITASQASEISQAVKLIAIELNSRTGRNEYGGVYGEFYRKFGITGYKQLPAHEFDNAIAFLTEWYNDLVGNTPF